MIPIAAEQNNIAFIINFTQGICKVLEKERFGISCKPEDWIRSALDKPKLRIIGLTLSVAYRSTVLPKPFHCDPGDQIIVATA